MKLLGQNFDGKRLVEEVRARLTARRIQEDQLDAPLEDEAPVEPFAYLVQALEGNIDPVEPTDGSKLREQPLRGLLRFATRGVLVEILSRQRTFNTQVYQLAAQLSAEVLTLRARVVELELLSSSASQKRPLLSPKPRAPRPGAHSRKPRRR
jgi:hypothetical protein